MAENRDLEFTNSGRLLALEIAMEALFVEFALLQPEPLKAARRVCDQMARTEKGLRASAMRDAPDIARPGMQMIAMMEAMQRLIGNLMAQVQSRMLARGRR